MFLNVANEVLFLVWIAGRQEEEQGKNQREMQGKHI